MKKNGFEKAFRSEINVIFVRWQTLEMSKQMENTCSPLVTVAVVLTSCVTTRCSWRFKLCVVVVATVFSSSCCVFAFLPKSSCVVAVRVVTAVAVTYAPDLSSGSAFLVRFIGGVFGRLWNSNQRNVFFFG